MIIEFKKVSKNQTPVLIENEGYEFKGFLSKADEKVAKLSGVLTGSLPSICDRCGEEFMYKIDENIDLVLTDGIVKLEESTLDLIECENSQIEIDEIVMGEVESILADYHYCKKCKKLTPEEGE